MKNLVLSRRDLMGRMSRAAVAAPMGSALLTSDGSMAQPRAIAGEESGVRVYNVRHYGAKGDGKTLDTAAFQAAIDACASELGGTVLAPAGKFLIGSIELKSNVTFHLAPAARLLGSTRVEDYKKGVERTPYGSVALIYANEAENVSLEGKGTIDGQGAAFLGRPDNERPFPLLFNACKNLSICDVFVANSAFWSTHFNGCEGVKIDGLRIHSRVAPNNDGLHFDDSRHVRISNCDVACGDDACCFFGSNRYVTVTNSAFSTRWSVFRFGEGITEDFTASNCIIYDTYGCPIKVQVRKDTRFENILFSNIIMDNVTGPIYLGIGSPPAGVEEWWNWSPSPTQKPSPGGTIRNITFEGIRATVAPAPDLKEYPWDKPFPGESRTCINLSAVDGQYIENVTLSNVHITFAGGGTREEAANREVTQTSGNEYFQFGILPAYGMYARNVRGLRIENVRFEVAAPDCRPAVVFEHVEDASINGFSAQGNSQAESLLRFTGTRDALLTACRVLTPCPAFLEVEGPANGGISIAACDLSKAAKPVVFSRNGEKEAVKIGP